MNRRRVSFLMVGVLMLGGLPSCSCRNNDRVRYVGPPPGSGPCDRCASNGPMPPRFVPNSGPVPAGPVPPPGSVAVPPPGSVVVPPPGGVAPPPAAAAPFAPSAAAAPGGLAPPSQAIQQNNYVFPGSSPATSPPAAAPRVYLEPPEPAAANPEARSYSPQTPEPPLSRDDRGASPALPVDIPQFAAVKTKIAGGQEPHAGGIDWLKAHGYRTVLHVRSPAEDDSAARKQFEQSGLRYLSLEVSPQTLSRQIVDQFNRLVADANNLPLFVYDKDGSLAGALWYLHFRLVDRETAEKAREDAERLGFKQERSDAHLKMWLAVQNLLKDINN
ncbi:MAG TPA: hypothetical protein VMF69_27820 [Gemmataceae bacterium]|nr:hypothetical protein [Gemmataceae bacterium]